MGQLKLEHRDFSTSLKIVHNDLKVSANSCAGAYRYGFGGHEKDDEIKGSGNHVSWGDYGMDPRIGRRWNIDPEWDRIYSQSPYVINNNNSILFKDPNGKFAVTATIIGGITIYEIFFAAAATVVIVKTAVDVKDQLDNIHYSSSSDGTHITVPDPVAAAARDRALGNPPPPNNSDGSPNPKWDLPKGLRNLALGLGVARLIKTWNTTVDPDGKSRETMVIDKEKGLSLSLTREETKAVVGEMTVIETTTIAEIKQKVKAGDNLTKIAKANNTTVDQLVKLNNLKDADHIEVGQELIIGKSEVKNTYVPFLFENTTLESDHNNNNYQGPIFQPAN